MADLNDIPEAVQWHEGMLLAPQHFQQSSLRSEALLGYMLGTTGLFPWGVRRRVIDRALLAAGRFRVVEIEAVLPDGLAVLHPRDGEPPLEVDLTPAQAELSEAAMAVHLTVPAETAHPEPGTTRRWRSVEGRPVADANTGDGEIALPRLRPVLSLALSASPSVPPSRNAVSIPIARVAFRDDAFVLDSFAPPRTDLPAGSELADLLRSVAGRIREKASAIADRLQAPAGGGDLPGGGLMEVLRSMVEPLPRLEGVVQAERVHPFFGYLALCDLMGNLSWMGGQPIPPAPPPYRHEDPLPAFATIADFLLRMVDRVRETWRVLRFERVADDRFSLAIEASMLAAGSLVIGARIAPGTTPADIAEWMAKALIGSKPALPAIGERRIRGAARRRIERAEEFGLVPPADMVLFRVTADKDFILAGEPLMVVGSSAGAAPAGLQAFVAPQAPVPKPPAGRR